MDFPNKTSKKVTLLQIPSEQGKLQVNLSQTTISSIDSSESLMREGSNFAFCNLKNFLVGKAVTRRSFSLNFIPNFQS